MSGNEEKLIQTCYCAEFSGRIWRKPRRPARVPFAAQGWTVNTREWLFRLRPKLQPPARSLFPPPPIKYELGIHPTLVSRVSCSSHSRVRSSTQTSAEHQRGAHVSRPVRGGDVEMRPRPRGLQESQPREECDGTDNVKRLRAPPATATHVRQVNETVSPVSSSVRRGDRRAHQQGRRGPCTLAGRVHSVGHPTVRKHLTTWELRGFRAERSRQPRSRTWLVSEGRNASWLPGSLHESFLALRLSFLVF